MATPDRKEIREVRLPGNVDPFIVEFMTLVKQIHETHRALREALGKPVIPDVIFLAGNQPVEWYK